MQRFSSRSGSFCVVCGESVLTVAMPPRHCELAKCCLQECL
eukprot:CAMPEP_0204231706 /NCGR_PEP_ID=MMETSP0361-20130328/88896_1 /ASSEMBLY_ACC=CAM_ASM_000343 /TAXON_ID=268821 /ORGANISM="Scrippsiella Hangoei, Strain SHTV-5" /LENGTH=40 /DNA_ID= /DNA_START= /DNA_END= /DNA_ORIENTATION=